MFDKLKSLSFFFLVIFIFSCGSKKNSTSWNLTPNLITATISNGKLNLNGEDFTEVVKAEIEIDGDKTLLNIESKTANDISFSGTSITKLVINKAFNLILTNAQAEESSFPITVELEDRTVEASHLSSMGASTGQILSYTGSSWVATNPLIGLHYAGTWDASTNTPSLTVGVGIPETYYIVSVAGSHNLGTPETSTWQIGDWAVFNGDLNRWEKISNSIGVSSVMGRTGAVTAATNDYTWDQIDKTVSSLGDIADVDLTGLQTDNVLKWNGTFWVPTTMTTTIAADSVTSIEIADGTITDTEISASANISQGKIANLVTDLGSKLPLAGGVMSGNLDMGTNNILNVGTINGINLTTLQSDVADNAAAIASVTKGDISEATSSILTITGGTDAVLGSGTSITVKQASSTQDGYLSSADWTTFNSKLDEVDLKFSSAENMAAVCNTANEGMIRYNTTYKNYQFCDGSLWREQGNEFYASSRLCIPADYLESGDVMVPVGDYCVDKYEMSIFSTRTSTGTQGVPADFKRDGSGTATVYAISKKGVVPTRDITWYQASVACSNSGKELIPDHIWQVAAMGTFDPQSASGTATGSEANSDAARCNISGGSVRQTGMAGATLQGTQSCVSRYGVEDMIGNIWEWTSLNGVQAGPVATTFSNGQHNATGAPFGTDGTWNINGTTWGISATTPGDSTGVAYMANQSAAALRGGNWNNGAAAGVFALSLRYSGSYSNSAVGARCARSR